MSDFGRELTRLMAERGAGVRQVARALYVNPGHLSNLRNGNANPSAELADALDRHLGGGGRLAALASTQSARGPRATRRSPSRAVEALRVTVNDSSGNGLDVAGEGLSELVGHYAHAVAVAPSAAVYDELLSARAFAGTLLSRGPARLRADLAVTAGWLSSLLAASATDLGDHAAAVVWCADTTRHGRDAGHPELAGWAALTRALIAWYQGDPVRSAEAARLGQAETAAGTAAYAKLAAQEMRCLAMLGDMAGMTDARRRAAAAISQLGPAAARAGVYSVQAADDPPYAATSLLVAGQHAEAAMMTRRILETAYPAAHREPGNQPTNYARTLLILALAAAGLSEVDEAAAAGATALDSGRLVWPTMVLARKLNKSLTAQDARSAHVADFQARYAHAGTMLALPVASDTRGNAG
jgi:hypothetical protein